ncbi:hypothetical protein BH20ACI4_BH20ACI4_26610 [soil metagenome]
MFCHKCGTKNPDNGKFCRSCGTEINIGSKALSGEVNLKDVYVDRRGRIRSNNPDDLWSTGIRQSLMGVGFFIISMALLITNVAGGHTWWWAMLFPAFSLLAAGIGNISKAKRLEKRTSANIMSSEPNQLPDNQPNNILPPSSTEYVAPERRYQTGDLVPPSVTDHTTRHLEMDSEGKTMTLPKK